MEERQPPHSALFRMGTQTDGGFCWNLKSKSGYSLKTRRAHRQWRKQCFSLPSYESRAEHCLGFFLYCRLLAAPPRSNSDLG
jgi:hypothetical protein